ncbi:hypothetical protein PINS_up003410 [Pythium insidiosum]|nr:hypothetical protein PINS_up003410 [Pythium insidiosum]
MLQRVNDDTAIFYHTATMDGVTSKTIFVLARVNVEEGYLIVFRTIDRHRVAFEMDAVNAVVEDLQTHQDSAYQSVWYDKFVWILIRDVPDTPNRCSYHFGGSALNVKWLSEVLFITLRWEALAVEPIRLLGPHTSADCSDGEAGAS